MPNGIISEDRFLYLRMETLCMGPVINCSPDMEVVEAARLMKERDLSAVAVVDDGTPLGVFSTGDLGRFLADSGGTAAGGRLRDNMRDGLITIGLRDFVFQAVSKMTRHNISHLGVVDDEGDIVGIIAALDLLQLQTRAPLYLYQEIEQAQSIEQLRALGKRILDVVGFALAANSQIKDIVQLICGFNDAITLRLIALLEAEGIRLPAGASYLVLGSEGRGEQTLRTDQDNALVYNDDLPPEQLNEVKRFADRIVEALEAVGVPRCPGNIMASSPQWCHSLTEWYQLVYRWITVPTPEHVLNFGMFQDLRSLHGDRALCTQLRDHIRDTVKRNAYFFPNMASHVVRFPRPFTMFGGIRVEQGGEQRGKVDLKKSGLFAITAGASLLALEAGIIGGNTWEKLGRLAKLGIISRRDQETIEAAFNHLTRLRLQHQLQELAAHCQPTNHVDPRTMADRERDQFRQALNGVNTFQWIFRDHYNLDYNSI